MAVPTNISGPSECLDDVANKVKLYMGHMQCATVQKRLIEELFNYLKKQEVEKSFCIVMDYTMKYKPMFLRESILQWFGRRVISWHGSVVFFKPLPNNGNEAEGNNQEENDIYSDSSTDRVDSYDIMKDVQQ